LSGEGWEDEGENERTGMVEESERLREVERERGLKPKGALPIRAPPPKKTGPKPGPPPPSRPCATLLDAASRH
jgi:hypothetical protein